MPILTLCFTAVAKSEKDILLSDSRYRNVLIARFSALGDVAMTVPVVYSVCEAHPNTHFVMITQQVASSLFVNKPSNLVVLGVDVKKKYHGIKGVYRLYQELKEEYKIDVFLDLHGVLRTWMLGIFCRLGGIPVKHIDKGRSGKWALTRRFNKRMFPLISSRERYREVFYRAGFVFNETFKSLFCGEKPEQLVFAEITEPKKEGERWIAIAPFAKHPGKIYPIHLMKKVLDEVASWKDVKIFLFGGGAEEQKVLGEWAAEFSNVTSLAVKRYGFPVELSLLSHCDVMVSMDSANMHLASLVCLPVVSVWGATHPYCGFMGWHQNPNDAVQLNMLCRPCSVFGNKPCRFKDFFCLSGIAPSLVVSHIKEVLKRNNKTAE